MSASSVYSAGDENVGDNHMSEKAETAAESAAPVIIDLGKQKKKRVKRLRKGEGRLMRDIAMAMEELKDEGVVTGGAQPVIVVVREKRKKNRWPI